MYERNERRAFGSNDMPVFGVAEMRGGGFVIYNLIRGLIEEESNSRNPQLEVPAVVVSKRFQVFGGENGGTEYYVTFELEGSEREEFRVNGRQYGRLAERDEGLLVRKGTKFVDFRRRLDKKDPAGEEWHECPGCGAIYKGAACEYCGTPWIKKN